MQSSYTTGEYLFMEMPDMTLTERYDTNYEQRLINEYNVAGNDIHVVPVGNLVGWRYIVGFLWIWAVWDSKHSSDL